MIKMFHSKKTTIFLIPDGKNKVKKIRFSNFLLNAMAFIFIASIPFLIWFIYDYTSMRGQRPHITLLKSENNQQKQQIKHLAQRITKISKTIKELQKIDRKLKIMVNLEEAGENTGYQGIGGSPPNLLDPKLNLKRQVRLMHNALDNIENEISLEEHNKLELLKFFENQKNLLAATPSIWPVKGWLSSRFGNRISPFTGNKEFHKGIDIATRLGTPIIAPADGIISYIGWDHGYGRMMTIKHGYGLLSRYAHIKKALIKKGQYVKRGDTIALVGNSGRSTGPHLHYEVHLNKIPLNPLHYILD